MSDSTATPDPCQATAPLLIQSRPVLYEFFKCCPRAQTFHAFSRVLLADVLIPVGCKTWGCWHCARQKIRVLSARTRDAKPTRMMTLTVDPSLWENPRAAFDGTRAQVPELIRRLRKRFGVVEYLRVTELTKAGWPHYHLLIRSNFLPQPVVQAAWQELTGAKIVDLRQVKKTFAAYNYLVKYLSKLHKIEWTERHVSYSKNFFAPEPERPKEDLQFERKEMISAHPVSVATEFFSGWELRQQNQNLFTIHPTANPFED